MKPLLVGEQNPYGQDLHFALYPAPERSAGWNLCMKVMQISRALYLRSFDRVNLCGARWSMREARRRADEVRAERRSRVETSVTLETPVAPVVLCGARVSEAFGVDFEPYTVAKRFASWPGCGLVARYVVLPHPSDRCRLWNVPGAYERARTVLREVGILPVVGVPVTNAAS